MNIDKNKFLNYLESYTAKERESISSLYIDFNFKYKGKNFYVYLNQSSDLDFTCLEEFIPAALFNSLEDAFRDEYYDYFIEKTDLRLISNNDFINYLRSIELLLDISLRYVYLIYDLELGRIFIGELTDGNYFILAMIDFNKLANAGSHNPKPI